MSNKAPDFSVKIGSWDDVVQSGDARVAAIESAKEADPTNIQQVYASQLQLINSYYESARAQSDRSFIWAVRAAAIGLIFFIAAIAFLLLRQPSDVAVVSVISGALIEVISGINFYLYAQTSKQLDTFHARLERTNRHLLANSVAQQLDGEAKSETIKALVQTIADVNLQPELSNSG